MRAATLSALAALLLVAASGCKNYAETVRCGNGLVLDDSDRCVPPMPDGSVDGSASIMTCMDLCNVIPDWTDAQRTCLTNQFSMLGTLPMSCTNLTTTDNCLTCASDTGATDAQCAAAPPLCPP